MQLFWELVSLIKTNQNPSKGVLLLMESLSTSSSTLGLTQIVKEELFAEILQFLRGGKTFLKGTESIDLHVKLRREYPILMDILLGLCNDEGCLAQPFRFLFFFLNNSQSPSASSQVIPHCCHRAHLEPVQVCSSEWWIQICKARDRRVETLPLPKFSTAEKKCKLHQRLSKSRFKSKRGLVRKELSNPPTTHTWIAPHDMCLSVKSSLWFFNDDDWGESSYVIWSHHEQIRKWLLPRYHLRCKL